MLMRAHLHIFRWRAVSIPHFSSESHYSSVIIIVLVRSKRFLDVLNCVGSRSSWELSESALTNLPIFFSACTDCFVFSTCSTSHRSIKLWSTLTFSSVPQSLYTWGDRIYFIFMWFLWLSKSRIDTIIWFNFYMIRFRQKPSQWKKLSKLLALRIYFEHFFPYCAPIITYYIAWE